MLVNGKYEAVDNVPTVARARTMAVDEKLHRIYLLAAEMGAPVEGKDGKKRALRGRCRIASKSS